MPTLLSDDDRRLESARLTVVLITIGMSVIGVLLLTLAPWSDWRTGLLLNALENGLLVAFIIKTGDRLIPRLMLFGLMLGLAELVADAWLVNATRTLDYSIGGGPILWRSPLWMPLAWQMVAVQFGYLGIRLYERFQIKGLVLTGLIGMINIPFYEEMALKIHWWKYVDCRMLLHTPYYIILGEFGIAIVIAVCARFTRREGRLRAAFWGLVAGILIFPCYAVAFALTDGWPSGR